MKIEKTEDGFLVEVNHQPSGGKEWMAKVLGEDERYVRKREFLRYHRKRWSYSGATGKTYFLVKEDGLYEVNEPWKGRFLVTFSEGSYNIERLF